MKKFSLTIMLFSAFAQLYSQDKKMGVIVATEFQVTRPIREIFAEKPVDENRPYEKKESGDREHRKAQEFPNSAEDNPAYGNDPKGIQDKMGDIPSSPTKANWPGLTASSFRPFDPSGAIGPNHYVQMINSTTFKIYKKTTGAAMLTGTLGDLWSPATGNEGDPIVMYDKAADRWFLAQFGSSSNKKIYIAVSTSNDPTGSYYTYTFVSSQFPDYLKFCVWQDGYYMTSNQSTQKVFCFEREAMLAGTPGARSIYVNYSPPKSGFFVPLPGDAADGTLPEAGTPCPIFSYSDNGWGSGYSDAVNIYNMAVNWLPATPTATITLAGNIPTAAFDASYDSNWNDVSQPGTSQKLDGIGGVCMYRAQWKSWTNHNSIVLNWSVRINSSQRSIKWCELRQNKNTGVWSMYQEGIYAPDASTRWIGSIAMDNNGSIGLSYLKSNASSIYPGLYYTGRRTCDPLGTLPVTEAVAIAGTGSQTGGANRVGDYAQTTLDTDGITFWNTSEYMGGSTGGNAARTRVFSYQITPCNSTSTAGVGISLSNGSNPSCTGSSVTFTAIPANGGTNPVYQWKVAGNNVGTNSSTYTTSSLINGQVVTCIMTSNLPGVTGNPASSNAITLNVNSVLTPSVSIAITSGSNPSAADASVSFTATPVNGGTNPSYTWKISGVTAGSNSPVFTTTALTNGQVITCVMSSSAACATPLTANSNAITMAITGVAGYCSAGTVTTSYEGISNVNFGNVDNTTANSSYTNYSSLFTNTAIGASYTVTVSIGSPYTTDKVLIWCDWNQNGVFTDPGEHVFTSATGVGPFSASISPPADATLGMVRMRIRLTDAGSGPNFTACGNSSYGEVEDYSLNVTEAAGGFVLGIATDPVNSLLNTELLSIYPSPNNGTFTIKAVNEGNYYILDETGKLVQSFKLNADNNYSILINDLSIGFYIVAGQNKYGISKQKIVVTK